jgi:hypothetical protein
MANLLTANIAGALSEGIARNTSPEREAERATAKAIKAEQDAKLKRVQSQSADEIIGLETEVKEQELFKLREQNRMLVQDTIKRRTFDAFDRFSADNDTRHLTTMIQDLKQQGLPTGPLGDIARVDKLSEQDKDALERLGFDSDAVLASPEALATLVRITSNTGETTIRSVDKLKGGTGYSRYASSRELQEQKTRAQILALLRRGQTGGGAGTKDEREAARLMQEKYPEVEQGSDEYTEKYNDEYATIVRRNRQTAAGKEEDRVDEVVAKIDATAQEKFGEDFFDLSMAEPKNRRAFERDIERMERLGKLSLSESEKKKISQIKQLIAVGDPASNISDKETGLIDRFSNNVQKFVHDKVEGVEATSAYSAYRNILRNALYGSVLTEGEMKAFRDQFGDLGQQTGPILVQFKTALTQLQGDMQALLDTNNSYVTHFRMGKDKEQLQDIIDGLQERVSFLGSMSSAGSDVIPAEQVEALNLNAEDMAKLDAIAKEVSQ